MIDHSRVHPSSGSELVISRREILKKAALGAAAATAGASLAVKPAEADAIEMRFGSDSPIGAPHSKSAVVMKQLVEAQTNGRVKVTIFPDGQLGDNGAMLNSIKTGSLDAVLVDVAHLSVAVPEVDVFNLPFLFKDIEHDIGFINSPEGMRIWPKINNAFACKVLAWAVDGSSDFLVKKRPVRTPADVVGLRFGLGSSKVQRDSILALGGIPTVLEFHELYTALETGLIDAVWRNPTDIVQFKLYQVTKYLTLSHHLAQPNALVVSNRFMATLGPEDQSVVRAAAKFAAEAQIKLVNVTEAANTALLQKYGIELIPLKDRKPFVDKMEPVYKETAARIGAELIEQARAFNAS